MAFTNDWRCGNRTPDLTLATCSTGYGMMYSTRRYWVWDEGRWGAHEVIHTGDVLGMLYSTDRVGMHLESADGCGCGKRVNIYVYL